MPDKAMTSAVPPVESKTVVVRWPDDISDLPIMLCNTLNVQPTPDGLVVTLGQASAPVLSGPPEEQMKVLRETSEVPVLPLFRMVMSVPVAQQFVGNLAAVLAQVEQAGLPPVAPPLLPAPARTGPAPTKRTTPPGTRPGGRR